MDNAFIINNGLLVNANTEISGSTIISGSLEVLGNARAPQFQITGDVVAYIDAKRATNIDGWTVVDTFDKNLGNSAKWMLSINSGSNFKTSEMLAIWNPDTNDTNFAEYTTNALGTVNVVMSVNISSGNVRLVANPSTTGWSIKMLRFIL